MVNGWLLVDWWVVAEPFLDGCCVVVKQVVDGRLLGSCQAIAGLLYIGCWMTSLLFKAIEKHLKLCPPSLRKAKGLHTDATLRFTLKASVKAALYRIVTTFGQHLRYYCYLSSIIIISHNFLFFCFYNYGYIFLCGWLIKEILKWIHPLLDIMLSLFVIFWNSLPVYTYISYIVYSPDAIYISLTLITFLSLCSTYYLITAL